ncbi:Aspartyl/glutamyl-tRNA(Asn/Gln) amidotransferase subunit C [Desulfovibrionales bacterium]
MSEPKKQVTTEDVSYIAQLARITINEKELNHFVNQFNDILAYMNQLSQCDTVGIEPLYIPMEHPMSLREDMAIKSCSRAEILQNTPEQDDTFFVVPRII